MNWCFGLVNGKLAEVFFNEGKRPRPYAYCHVKKEDYKTKEEQKWIEKDTKHVNLLYKNGKFTRIKPKVSQ